LVLLDADVVGVASHYRRNAKRLSDGHRRLLEDLLEDLNRVRSKLPSDTARDYYAKVGAIAEYLLANR
jgi:hypothetical protein